MLTSFFLSTHLQDDWGSRSPLIYVQPLNLNYLLMLVDLFTIHSSNSLHPKSMFLFLVCFLVHSRDSKIVTSSHFQFYLAIVWSWKYHVSSSFMYVSPQCPKWSLKFIEPPGSEMWARLFVGLDLLTQESSWCGSSSCPGLAEPFTARGPLMALSGGGYSWMDFSPKAPRGPRGKTVIRRRQTESWRMTSGGKHDNEENRFEVK